MHSTVLGGQVVAELNGSGGWTRGYVYAGGQLIALQEGGVYWAHQDPINKSQRLTDMWGNIVAGIELDPWGGETNRSWNTFYQPHRYTSWERGWTGDESLFRRYHGWFSRFAHPDPYDGSYNSTDPQSFNRYAYVQNDPVNFVDPSGLESPAPDCGPGTVAQKDKRGDWQCVGTGVSVVNVNVNWDDMSGYLPDWTAGSSNHFFFGLLMAPLIPLLPEPQDLRKIKEVSDCDLLASIVDQLAFKHPFNTFAFVKSLKERFTKEGYFTANTEFKSTGFRDEFRDDIGPDNSPNQVRHYVGGLRAVFVAGLTGSAVMTFRERHGTRSNQADLRLNKVSKQHAFALLDGVSPKELANMIRRDVCAP